MHVLEFLTRPIERWKVYTESKAYRPELRLDLVSVYR